MKDNLVKTGGFICALHKKSHYIIQVSDCLLNVFKVVCCRFVVCGKGLTRPMLS